MFLYHIIFKMLLSLFLKRFIYAVLNHVLCITMSLVRLNGSYRDVCCNIYVLIIIKMPLLLRTHALRRDVGLSRHSVDLPPV